MRGIVFRQRVILKSEVQRSLYLAIVSLLYHAAGAI